MRRIPGIEESLDQFMLRDLSFRAFAERILIDDLVTSPGAYIAQKQLERLQVDSRLQTPCRVLSATRGDEEARFGAWSTIHSLWTGESRKEFVVYRCDLIFVEFSTEFQVSYSCPFREHLNLVGDYCTETFSFRVNGFLRNHVELSEGDHEKLLEIGYGPDSRIRMIGMR